MWTGEVAMINVQSKDRSKHSVGFGATQSCLEIKKTATQQALRDGFLISYYVILRATGMILSRPDAGTDFVVTCNNGTEPVLIFHRSNESADHAAIVVRHFVVEHVHPEVITRFIRVTA